MQVIWLPQALTRLMQLYEYGKFHFGQKSAEKLMNGIRFDSERLVAFATQSAGHGCRFVR